MQKKALIVIDIQEAFFNGKQLHPVYNAEQLVNRINTLTEKARQAGAPVIFIKHNGPAGQPLEEGTDGNRIFSGLHRMDSEAIVEKRTPSAFYQSGLSELLTSHSVEKIVVCGVQSEVCVDTTCRTGHFAGYSIELVQDAHSTWDRGGLSAQEIIDHHNSILPRWFAEGIPAEQVQF